jgi:hypothetical protein
MPAYIHCFSAPNFAASLWQSFDSPTDTDLIQSIKPSFFILKSFEKLFCLKNFSAVIDMFAFTLLFFKFQKYLAINVDFVNIFEKLLCFRNFSSVIDFMVFFKYQSSH